MTFKVVQLRPEGSDCTAPYSVELNGEYTVAEFIHDVLLNKREWGYIYIDSNNTYREPLCEYRNGELKTEPKAEYLNLKVTCARAHGGWSCMDYVLTLEPINDEFVDVTEHFCIRLEDVLGIARFVVYRKGKTRSGQGIASFKNHVAALNECKYLERIHAKKLEMEKK